MFKLVKYELRANFLTIIGICITVIVASLLLMTQKGTWSSTAILALSGCLIIGSVIVIFIASLKIMSKYLHNDSGYLLFTLPQSGMSIITSRLLASLIQISIIVAVSFFMSYLTLTDKIDFSFLADIKPGLILYSIINYVGGIIYFLTIIYFCMVIGKIALKGKKIGKIGSFVIFIILSIVIGWLSSKITNLLPQNLNFSDFSINTTNVLNFGTTASESAFNINLAGAIFDIIVFIGLFMGTSYLIDKKLDLS
ncbi:hypothetical protein [Clostridium estertheticum]|uniref:Uncharacterized protein n=1 Tax=Clostridium estertheticum subsp. estertheticum TaxID=1552 RepID=A0A1J0GJC6_9CLOT|nr:hypothetical protein [Clostridium estertheticum]APC41506.1 hypothetical protein A7L45_16185 [Clostridium estertheticum subsp. estertheticum]MBU3172612.1 hypothetical protein [Clostridium estertheticum]MBZ9616584.1 hypothetical protein [Clostridium estertheticum subsp. laramiense]MCB2341731.1 hypothetical protein [Clostridium estertheticum]WAG72309.1 hypothetical protein LL032_14160 [Clostridium estertheticum]